MRKVAYLSVLLLLLTMSLWTQGENQEPVVSDPIAKQLDYEHVLISYQVEDGDGDLITVSVKVSDDGGKTFGFTVPREQLSGDVGEEVNSGRGKEIVWTIATDEFLHVYGENFAIRVLADDGVKPVSREKITWEKDNSQMALIPVGSFEMGDHLDGLSNALPVHTVELDEFYMDTREVTVGQFREFVNQSGYNYGGNWNDVAKYSPGDEYPMVLVNWNDATAYAGWAGKRLPTEAEWEYAVRGGLVGKRYPWGDEISHDDANYDGTGGKAKWSKCSPVGSFAANGYGLYDMTGNVYEWCQDWSGSDYDSNTPAKNPSGPVTGKYRVLQGGGWDSSTLDLRVAYRIRNAPLYQRYSCGFRCVSGSN